MEAANCQRVNLIIGNPLVSVEIQAAIFDPCGKDTRAPAGTHPEGDIICRELPQTEIGAKPCGQ
jgi:hypothetical protein